MFTSILSFFEKICIKYIHEDIISINRIIRLYYSEYYNDKITRRAQTSTKGAQFLDYNQNPP